MATKLRYISISHETASVMQRERYFIPEEEKKTLIQSVCSGFPDITGILLLVTCNRTELYFESEYSRAATLRDFISRWYNGDTANDEVHLFRISDETETTLKHLLNVSSGLSSQVLGDAEIVHQMKKAYHCSMRMKLQGSLLERAMQSVFKTHKRISNETEFRDGTTSTAYKSLKVISKTFRGQQAPSKKILLIGSGDIVRQLLKYNRKFGFKNLYLSNRTRNNALALCRDHNCTIYEWEHVLDNTFDDFDVIISAVSNCHHLISSIAPSGKKRVLIDLALPGNIDSTLGRLENITFYDLDTISAELEDTKDKRLASIQSVHEIIAEEMQACLEWYSKAPLRAMLAEYKILLNQKVSHYLKSNSDLYDAERVGLITDQVIRTIIREGKQPVSPELMDTLIEKHAVPEQLYR